MSRQLYSRPIIALLIALICGIVLGDRFSGYTVSVLIIGFFSAGYIGTKIIYKKSAAIAPLIFFTALGYISVQPWLSPNFSINHVNFFSEEIPWQIGGVVDSYPVEFKYLKRFVLRADTLKHKNVSYRVTGKIRVSVTGPGPQTVKGDRVEFRSRLREIRNFNNPGGFDYQRLMAFQEVWRSAYTQGSRLKLVGEIQSKDLLQQVRAARRAVAALIDRAGKQQSGAVLKALVIGDRSALSTEIREAFNRAGVSHILAISGLHIGIVATVAFFFFQKLLSFIKPLLWRAWARKAAAILTLLPVCIYGLISGMSPSTQRALIMIIAFLMTFLVERDTDAINILSVAALIILIIYPPSLFSISFQLSFLAVLSILYGLSRIRLLQPAAGVKAKTAISWQWHRKILVFLLVSLFAICGTLPVVMFYFNQISLIGLFANCIVVPLVGFGVIPCGLLATFIYPFSEPIALGGMRVCTQVLDYVLILINYLADLQFAAVKTFTPSLLEIVCYYILGWLVLDQLAARSVQTVSDGNFNSESHPGFFYYFCRSRPGLSSRYASVTAIQKWIKAVPSAQRRAAAALVVIAVFAADTGYWLFQRYWRSELRVTYIDVGQGSAALLELP